MTVKISAVLHWLKRFLKSRPKLATPALESLLSQFSQREETFTEVMHGSKACRTFAKSTTLSTSWMRFKQAADPPERCGPTNTSN